MLPVYSLQISVSLGLKSALSMKESLDLLGFNLKMGQSRFNSNSGLLRFRNLAMGTNKVIYHYIIIYIHIGFPIVVYLYM